MVYIKLFVDYLDAIEPLGDAERGRLFTALLEYAKTGEAPQLGGNERFIFPMMKAQLDRDNATKEELSIKRSNAAKASKSKQNEHLLANAHIDKDKEEDKDKDKDKEVYIGDKRPRTRFVPPSLEEVTDYCFERGNIVDPQRWYDYYASNGWKVGKNQMKDWKAAVRTWERNGVDKPKQPAKKRTFLDMYMEDDE